MPEFRLLETFFCKMFTLDVLEGTLDFSKFRLFIDETCILIGLFWILVEDDSMSLRRGQQYRWQRIVTISDCLHHKVNVKENHFYMLTQLTKGVQTK